MMNEVLDPDCVAILWSGLPHYAAAAISAAIRRVPKRIVVIATRPELPVTGIEETVGAPIHWIAGTDSVSFRDLGEKLPSVAFITGWSVPSFMRLAHEVHRAGGKVVCMCDNSFRGDMRQVAGAVVYRLKYRRLFDHVWVPGNSAFRLMRFFGVPASRITRGLYTADDTIFTCKTPIQSRPLRFVFAGQFIARKNVIKLCDAFLQFRREVAGPCDLHLYGSGMLRDRIPVHPDLHVHSFATPDRLSAALNQARCLVLPSTIDHWGLVVHEGALCGTLLIVSHMTGAADELCGPLNSRLVHGSSVHDLIRAFRWVASLESSELALASRQSQDRAAAFGIDGWVAAFRSICDRLTAEPGRR